MRWESRDVLSGWWQFVRRGSWGAVAVVMTVATVVWMAVSRSAAGWLVLVIVLTLALVASIVDYRRAGRPAGLSTRETIDRGRDYSQLAAIDKALTRPGMSGDRIPWKDLSHGTSQ